MKREQYLENLEKRLKEFDWKPVYTANNIDVAATKNNNLLLYIHEKESFKTGNTFALINRTYGSKYDKIYCFTFGKSKPDEHFEDNNIRLYHTYRNGEKNE